jgi:hypothetical protein
MTSSLAKDSSLLITKNMAMWILAEESSMATVILGQRSRCFSVLSGQESPLTVLYLPTFIKIK